jgi:hypothetical protein
MYDGHLTAFKALRSPARPTALATRWHSTASPGAWQILSRPRSPAARTGGTHAPARTAPRITVEFQLSVKRATALKSVSMKLCMVVDGHFRAFRGSESSGKGMVLASTKLEAHHARRPVGIHEHTTTYPRAHRPDPRTHALAFLHPRPRMHACCHITHVPARPRPRACADAHTCTLRSSKP